MGNYMDLTQYTNLLKNNGRKFSFFQIYLIVTKALASVPFLAIGKKKGIISEQFFERIMLSVTEVNGCAICSYAHAKTALLSGISNDEVHNLLLGNNKNIPTDEQTAIFFAQHYAETRGKFDKGTFESLIKQTGIKKAVFILSAIRLIMFGNGLGIPLSSFILRLQGKKHEEKARIVYEIALPLFTLCLLPLALLHGVVYVISYFSMLQKYKNF